jgi:hypothetical protein
MLLSHLISVPNRDVKRFHSVEMPSQAHRASEGCSKTTTFTVTYRRRRAPPRYAAPMAFRWADTPQGNGTISGAMQRKPLRASRQREREERHYANCRNCCFSGFDYHARSASQNEQRSVWTNLGEDDANHQNLGVGANPQWSPEAEVECRTRECEWIAAILNRV